MRKVIFVVIGLIVSIETFAQLGYRYEGRFIQLIPSTTERYYVQTRNPESREYLESVAKKGNSQNSNKDEVTMISENEFFVSSKTNLMENDYISELFYDTQGNPYYILPRIILALKDNAQIDDVIKRYTDYIVLDSVQRLKGMITLTCNLSDAKKVLKVVAELDSNDEVVWCEPDMKCKWELYNNNPLFSMQYYLQNNYSGQYDINVVPAWAITTGSSNITVAVIDQGVDPDHEDLSGNVLQGYTIGNATGYGKPQNVNNLNYKSHGIACAGIVGAKNNDKGILGVAYGVNILPVNIVPDFATEEYVNGIKIVKEGFANNSDIADAILWAAERADILSCSWGSNSEENVIKTAINNAMNNGRNGKGCIVVAASGNGYPSVTTIGFPARMDGVIAVGAIDRYGSIQTYSQRGSELDLVAPSGGNGSTSDIVTTDRMGNLGYNPNVTFGIDLADLNYTQTFGGTSAACPQVAGVAALMLSANPNLTVNQVRSILHNTATDLGTTGFDTTYGYGLVNAFAAVVSVMNLNIVGPETISTSGTYYISNLPSGVTVEWSLSNSYYNQNCLQQNYPAQNQCTITRSSSYNMLNATLTAAVKYNGTTVQTLTKTGINAYTGFVGTYTSSFGSGSYTAPNPIFTASNSLVTIYSTKLIGATLTRSGDITPTYWMHTGNKLEVGIPSTGGTVVVNVSCQNGESYTIPIVRANIPYGMNVIFNGESLTITLDESASEDQNWLLEIANVMTGEKAITMNVAGKSISLNTSGLKQGLYAVRVTIGKEVLTEKIQIKATK